MQYDPYTYHSDDLAIARFANAMSEKMAACRAKGRGGWDDPEQCSIEFLKTLLVNEFYKGKSDLVDIADYCMMLHQRGVKTL